MVSQRTARDSPNGTHAYSNAPLQAMAGTIEEGNIGSLGSGRKLLDGLLQLRPIGIATTVITYLNCRQRHCQVTRNR